MAKIKKIYKGFHRPFGFIPAGLKDISVIRSKKKQRITKIITFTESCRYKLDNNDQYDWNKLFGVCFGWDGIHKNSARFVWRYNGHTDRIEIATYNYVDGIREIEKITSIKIGIGCKFEIEREGNRVWFFINDDFAGYNDSFKTDRCLFAYGCGLYFGGNRCAPKTIEFIVEN